MPSNVICTVGASMRSTFQDKNYNKLKELYESDKTPELVSELVKMTNDTTNDRFLGAEINSISSIIEHGYVSDRKNIYFLVSDTVDGRKIGEILKEYFKKVEKISFENIHVEVVEKLDDSNQYLFKKQGLRNLVRKIAILSRKHYGDVLINATGGYKAQIAFATALGQSLKVPVFYMFERFPEVIELDPLPLTLDSDFYFNYERIFELFEQDDMVELNKEYESMYNAIPQDAKMFFDFEEIDGVKYLSLSPLGQIFLESVRNHFYNLKKKIKLRERDGEFKFQSSTSEGHSKEMINKTRIKEILEEFKYIELARVTKYSQSEVSEIRVTKKGDEQSNSSRLLSVTIGSKTGILHLEVETTARNRVEQEIIRQLLKEHLEARF
ncbi:MAG: putative CRISPR-associated protein [Candidatus Aenigmatarchaeota archaeon]